MEVDEYLYKLALLGEIRVRFSDSYWNVEQDRRGMTISIRNPDLGKALGLLLESASGENG